MATYVIDERKLSIEEVAEIQEAQQSGRIASLIPIINRLVITEDGLPASKLSFDEFESILEAIAERLNRKNPNSKGK